MPTSAKVYVRCCAEFGNPYFRRVTHERRYPEEFVTALTKARWLSALIPKEYGGSMPPN